jgi:hypothetical protein
MEETDANTLQDIIAFAWLIFFIYIVWSLVKLCFYILITVFHGCRYLICILRR